MFNIKKINFSDSQELRSFFRTEGDLANSSFVIYRFERAAGQSRSKNLGKIIYKAAIYYEVNIGDYYTAARLYKLIGDIRNRRNDLCKAQSYYYLAYKNYLKEFNNNISIYEAAKMSILCASLNSKLKRHEIASRNELVSFSLLLGISKIKEAHECLERAIQQMRLSISEEVPVKKTEKEIENILLKKLFILAEKYRDKPEIYTTAYFYEYLIKKIKDKDIYNEKVKTYSFRAAILYEKMGILKKSAEFNRLCGESEIKYGLPKKAFIDYMISIKQYLILGSDKQALDTFNSFAKLLLLKTPIDLAIDMMKNITGVFIEYKKFSIAGNNYFRCAELELDVTTRDNYYKEAANCFLMAADMLIVTDIQNINLLIKKAKDIYISLNNTLGIAECELRNQKINILSEISFID